MPGSAGGVQRGEGERAAHRQPWRLERGRWKLWASRQPELHLELGDCVSPLGPLDPADSRLPTGLARPEQESGQALLSVPRTSHGAGQKRLKDKGFSTAAGLASAQHGP